MPDTQSQAKKHTVVHLVFDRDLTEAQIEQIRQSTDALVARAAAAEAAHHHDVTK
jgi:hypothetical protein